MILIYTPQIRKIQTSFLLFILKENWIAGTGVNAFFFSLKLGEKNECHQ